MAHHIAEFLEHLGYEWQRIFMYTGLALLPVMMATYHVTGNSVATEVTVMTEANILFGMAFANFLILIAHLLKERDGRE